MTTAYRISSAAAATVLAMLTASAAMAQLTDAERTCANAVYKSARNIGNQEQKSDRSCVKDGSGDIDACVDVEGAAAATKRAKLLTLDDPGGKCATTPAFGVSSYLAGVADRIERGADNILRGAFGDPVDGIVAGDKCQGAVVKRIGKKYATQLNAFRRCAKGLASIDSIGDPSTCIGIAVSDAKAANFEAKLVKDMDRHCDFAGNTAPPAGMEDGDCSSCTSGATCAACVGHVANCQACKALNLATGGSANCELLDDGLVNDSCITCGIEAAGRYTLTSTGGMLKVTTFSTFPFPAGATIVQDVSAADDDCVSTTVVPYPGGLTIPAACIPATGYSVRMIQTGCGVGIIDSNGGSDLGITENGDTSSALFGCAASQSCAAFADGSGQIEITVGDGSPDACSSGTGNAMVSIPAKTVIWQSDDGCPDPDNSPSEGDDTIVAEFDQTLDLTTDRAVAQFSDVDPDGCSRKGNGPNGPYTQNQLCTGAGIPFPCCAAAASGTCVGNGAVGQCIDFAAQTVSVAGGGTVFSSAAPLYDLLFTTAQSATLSDPAPFGGASCGSPPTIGFAGVTHRCVIAP